MTMDKSKLLMSGTQKTLEALSHSKPSLLLGFYNVLPIPLLFAIIVYSIYQKKIKYYINKYKVIIIIFSTILMIVVWVINVLNPLLY